MKYERGEGETCGLPSFQRKKGEPLSYHDYIKGRELTLDDPPFYALVQAAMRRADSENLEKLKSAFPEVWEELYARYHAPGGRLPGDERR